MEDVLRWSLLVIGGCIIIGVAVHGIWVSRKNTESKTKDYPPEQSLESNLQGDLDQDSEQNFDQEHDIQEWSIGDEGQDLDRFQEFNFSSINIGEQELTHEPEQSDDQQIAAQDDSPITSAEQFDDLGIGAVRVVSSSKEQATKSKLENEGSSGQSASQESKTLEVPAEKEDKSAGSAGKIYASVVTQPKPEYAQKYQSLASETVAIAKEEKITANASHQGNVQATNRSQQESSFNISKVSNSDLNPARISISNQDNYQAPEPPPFLLKKDQASQESIPDNKNVQTDKPKAQAGLKESLSEQARNLVKRKKADSGRKKREPKIADDQMRIDFDEEPIVNPSNETKVEPELAKQKQGNQEGNKPNESQQEVLVLNVKVADDSSIPGSALLPMLLTLGFKFGDQDIFHRHVNSNGKGPVLFSLANMFKPGNFDIDNLENFTTQGVSLFMILPIEGEPHQVFNMMHNAARKIADEFSAQIYDSRRSLLTKQSLQQYVEKIREFERQRILNR
ncbi:cell division protein ZipA [Paraglaciecola aquimarina]|uniref:Cell division protein ZipA n=1 Tax=Paraglaciecola algarum TaxID=3050085 RepID=A0ABS9D2G2_9ALTE|nr:cell division protein ZipA [Paraglaciecola sp. G1-23]MCF2947112.1 cell division protein ZipA [Paraglaciecola sp. G1-23]